MTNQETVSLKNYNNIMKCMECGYDNVMGQIIRDDVPYPVRCEDRREFCYFKIDEIAYEKDESSMEQILYALYSVEIEFNVVFSGNSGKIGLYIGAAAEDVLPLYQILNGCCLAHSEEMEAAMKGETEEVPCFAEEQVFAGYFPYAGVIYGDIFSEKKNLGDSALIDKLLESGAQGDFKLVVVARPIERSDIYGLVQIWSELESRGKLMSTRQVSVRDDLQSVSYTDISYKVANYMELVHKFVQKYQEAVSSGLWETSVKYYAKTEELAETVAGIILSVSEAEEFPIPVQRMKIGNLRMDGSMLTDGDEIMVDEREETLEFPVFSNLYLAKELAVIVDFPHKDKIGVTVRRRVNFELSQKINRGVPIGTIQNYGRDTHTQYVMDLNELNRHALVVGLTGAGKTNTLKSILVKIGMETKNVPFLVIEPAKREYWQLYNLGCRELTIFSVGGTENALRINPFQRVGNVTIQTHIDRVFAAFKASFIMYPPMPYALERAIYAIYEDCGWDIGKNVNPLGEVYPTIEQLYYKIPVTVRAMGYDGREQANITGALQARIHSLRVGVKSRCLNVKESYPVEDILSRNTVMELEDVGDEETKAFIMSLLLIQVSEWRSSQPDSQKKLQHLILIEEAHRLLKNIPSGSEENADPRGNAVEMFCNMLAELRSKGQGFVIADQIPSKLAPDAVKNTNLKLVHRIVDGEDRKLMGDSMHMTEEQTDFLSVLPQGECAIYAEGDYYPKLIRTPFAEQLAVGGKTDLKREQVMEKCRPGMEENAKSQSEIPFFCAMCPLRCDGKNDGYARMVKPQIDIKQYADKIENGFDKDMLTVLIGECLETIREETHDLRENWSGVFCMLKDLAEYTGMPKKQQYMIYLDAMEILSCLNFAPASWKG